MDEDGVYTLKPVKHMIATSYDADTIINCSNVRLDGIFADDDRAYGNDNSTLSLWRSAL